MSNILDWLDDSTLDPYEFRVLLRISRKTQQGITGESTESISRACMIGKEKVKQSIESLIEKGFLTQEGRMPPEEIKAILGTKIQQRVNGASCICEWCNGTTFILHQHHYPVSKADGGNQTVSICANCHCEFHYLEQVKQLKPTFVLTWESNLEEVQDAI